MAAKKKARKKSILKSTVLNKRVDTAVTSLAGAAAECNQAVDVLGKDVKKLTAEAKRLGKKRAVLAKRKKAATKKVKSSPGADTRKALNAVVKELAVVSKQAPKARAAKATAAAELSGLKSAAKRLNAYVKNMDKVNKDLSKPAKKRRKRRKAVAA
jgi:hypothetical protein